MQFDILTLFPDIIYNYTEEAIVGRAQRNGLINVSAHNFRDFSGNKWGHVDDKPYGGGPGMILRVEPIYECLKAIGALSLRGGVRTTTKQSLASTAKASSKSTGLLRRSASRNDNTKVIVMDPAGKKFDQRMAEKFSKLDRLVMVCGRYEGFDARVYELADERVSVGDFVLAGGELAALSILEATSRLLPGVLGNQESLVEETFGRNVKLPMTNVKSTSKSKAQNFDIGNLSFDITKEYPQYTRPEEFMNMKVPQVLLSGDHKKIGEWRKSKQK